MFSTRGRPELRYLIVCHSGGSGGFNLLITFTMEFLTANFCGQILTLLSTCSVPELWYLIACRDVCMDWLHWLLQRHSLYKAVLILKTNPYLTTTNGISRQGDFSVSIWQPRPMQFASATIWILIQSPVPHGFLRPTEEHGPRPTTSWARCPATEREPAPITYSSHRQATFEKRQKWPINGKILNELRVTSHIMTWH